MQNRDVFLKDPLETSIPNLGVAKIGAPSTPEEWAVLRFELTSFVCAGAYASGLERILSSYLRNLTQPQQPAVWVGGFYGSGKSHLLRVLEYLWSDVRLPDGATARGLTTLPSDLTAQLTELSTRGRQEGGLWSAAGTLSASANTSVRLALLAIFFRAAGLPEAYPTARLALWLRQQGYEAGVVAALQERGKTLESELPHMFVSPHLAAALAEAVPDFPRDVSGVRAILQAQYPARVTDISNEELVTTMQDVLQLQSTTPGKLPCTLVVIDELQQYLGEDTSRTLAVQQAVEACSAKFGSRLLFVASGQSALAAHRELQRLQGRFTVPVTLSDTDVEQVVRQVVLRKAPDRVAPLETLLRDTQGEIDRELAGTRIGPSRDDTLSVLVADYPLLPARRRFLERVLRAVDTGGAAGLRTQLRVVHEATQAVAMASLGTVIAGDVIYDEQQANMLQTGVLLRGAAETIERLADGTPEGRLRSRLCKLIFLIGKLPTEGPLATGIRPTADALADLLVDDLRAGDTVRAHAPTLLDDLVQTSTVLRIADEYRLQTPIGQEWDSDFRQCQIAIRNDDSRLAGEREAAIRQGLERALGALSLPQGVSKTARKGFLYYGPTPPPTDTSAIPIWVHDGWAESESSVKEAAQAAGQESAIVHLYLPRLRPDSWREELARLVAATECLQQRPEPTTAEGREARDGMRSRQGMAQQGVAQLIAEVFDKTTVFIGGGTIVPGDSVQAAVRSALEAALVRLFPRFAQADLATWDRVFDRATQGNADALALTGYSGPTEQHPVCREVRLFVGSAGKKGADVRKHFTTPPFGWPQDAVDAALAALVVGGLVRAGRNGAPITVKQITHAQISSTDFASEGFSVSAAQRLAVRGLLQKVGSIPRPNEEALAIPPLLSTLRALAQQAGGAAPAPEPPATTLLDNLQARGGNEQFIAVYEQRAALAEAFDTWSERRDRIAGRLPAWRHLAALLARASALPEAQAIAQQADAIKAGRQLLADPDPVAPLLTALTDLLRTALQERRERFVQERAAELAALRATKEWNGIPQQERQQLEQKHGLGDPLALPVGTAEEVATTLQALPLGNWETMLAALPAQAAAARAEAARRTHPNPVAFKPPAASLASEADVDAYLQGVRTSLITLVKAHKLVIM